MSNTLVAVDFGRGLYRRQIIKKHIRNSLNNLVCHIGLSLSLQFIALSIYIQCVSLDSPSSFHYPEIKATYGGNMHFEDNTLPL